LADNVLNPSSGPAVVLGGKANGVSPPNGGQHHLLISKDTEGAAPRTLETEEPHIPF
jgi:hypothetical protein